MPKFSTHAAVLVAASLACVAVMGSVRVAAGGGPPVAEEPLAVSEYTFGADVPEASRDEIRLAVDVTAGWLRSEAGLQAPPVHVIASADQAMLLREYGRGGAVPDRDRVLLNQWFETGGAITSGLSIFLYTNGRWNSLERTKREFIVAHEVFHTLEYSEAARSGNVIPGPIWLVEGAAEYVAARVVAAQGSSTYESYLSAYREEAKGLTQPLGNLGSYGSGGVAWGRLPQYTLGFLASDRLVTQAGLPAFLGVWRAMGAGLSFDGAFAAAFEELPGRFYAAFDESQASR